MINNVVKFIDRQALVQNAFIIKKNNYPSRLCAVVKSNAYGHNSKQVVRAIQNVVDYFAVNDNNEAIEIRKWTTKPILVIGSFSENHFLSSLDRKIEFSVFCKKDLIKIAKKRKNSTQKCFIHIKLNTGMNRLGVSEQSELLEMLELINQNKNIVLSGIFTHMGSGKGKRTDEQLAIFYKFCKAVPPTVPQHFANSEVALTYQLTPTQMARVGISLYGYGNFPNLLPVMSVSAKIINISCVSKGEYVGYGKKHKAKRDMRIAVINIGYADGLMRCYEKKGWVIIKNKKAKIIANICMNMTIVDISHIEKVKKGDWAIILGKSDNLKITAEDIAKKCGTISYEILTNFNNIPCTKKKPTT